ncbi:beta-N-acetylhexosaminidase [Arenimonas sp. MALMAid1274]|uniref:beta-N-acetylhexosaminidase n=1 Tax=Arenimonas sp. MALMAid1274 TaxID=3411630 RepID=UPI003BA1EE89
MLVIGTSGPELLPSERDWLQHPAVAGVILFSRNFQSRDQVRELCAAIRDAAPRPQLICVDQEGGRVQRFRDGYHPLPSLEGFGRLFAVDPRAATQLAREHAWLMASEIRVSGLDLSFAPVVDLGRGNRAIGDRAFHAEPDIVAEFTRAYVAGMHEAGMAATLKHFPGHGSVLEDTHFDDAVDPRGLDELEAADLRPFAAGIAAGADAVMMAHVRYPAVASEPAGYSPHWIRTLLRERLGFRGVVFSDDIGMAAALAAGGVKARINAHLDAGCDAVLACAPALVPDALACMDTRPAVSPGGLAALMGRGNLDWPGLAAESRYDQARTRLSGLTTGVS